MKRHWRWLLVLCWMIVIFLFSSQPAGASSQLSERISTTIAKMFKPDFTMMTAAEKANMMGIFNIFVRKTAHCCEYFILALLVSTAAKPYRMKLYKRLLFILLFCAFYACTDEFHQLFVQGRSCMPTDVLIDTSGAAIGATVFTLINHIKNKAGRHTRMRAA